MGKGSRKRRREHRLALSRQGASSSGEGDKPKSSVVPPAPSVRPPTLHMEVDAYKRMRAYVDLCSDEITGFGTCSLDKAKNTVYVHKVFILPQEVSCASAEIEEEDIAVMLDFAVRNDINPETIKFWWHSHVNMEAFWSGTDTATINLFQNGWMVSLVTNKRSENKVRLDIYKPFRTHVEMASPRIFFKEDAELKKEIKEEIDEKVKRRVSSTGGYLDAYGGYPDGYGGWGWWNRFQRGVHDRSYGGRYSSRRFSGRGSSDSDRWGYGRGSQSTQSTVRGKGYWEAKSRGPQILS